MAGTQITVTLPPELEAFIEERVATGRFVLTPAAEGDLLSIIEYLEGDTPNAVLKVVDALAETDATPRTGGRDVERILVD